ncbi:MAG: succinylglutamate desuccinylase/aspartoacylase family protein [Candidatus Komeilibacteria bacterium]
MKYVKPIIIGQGKPIITIVGCVHGEEPVGKKVTDKLKDMTIETGTLRLVIANNKALQKNKRYIDEDLNRCFPGKKDGNHEQRLAAELKKFLSQSDFVISLHSTSTNTKDVVIIKKNNAKVRQMLKAINPKRVVHFPKGMGDGALENHHQAAIAFEYGYHFAPATFNKSLRDIKKLIVFLGMLKATKSKAKTKTSFFSVYGSIDKPKGFKMKKIQNFKLIRKGDTLGWVRKEKISAPENFYPVLFGPKAYPDIMGFKSKKK